MYGKPTKHYLKHFKSLLNFVIDYYDCLAEPVVDNPTRLENMPRYPTRIARSNYEPYDYFVSDPLTGSVYVYDPMPDGTLADRPKAEIKNLGKPLGIAVDTNGYLLVGSNQNNLVGVYDPTDGQQINTFGESDLEMPTAITVGPNSNIYVVDSRSNTVYVYNANYQRIGSIGTPGDSAEDVLFPTDVAIFSRDIGGTVIDEVYVADSKNQRIQVYDTNANHLRGTASSRMWVVG
jgi:DNA-binding beta-propeller fold protein YncE